VKTRDRVLRLPPADRRLRVEAFVLVAIAHVAVRVLSFATVRRLVAWAARPASARPPVRPAAVRRAVEAAARALPGSTCLMTGLAAHVLLARGGRPSRLSIGIAPESKLRAHAWVESRSEVVVGGRARPGYRPVFSIEAAPR